MRIGIDIGGVIIDRVKDGQLDTSFKTSEYTDTPAVPDAFSCIKLLVELAGSENVFLVSVVDEANGIKTDEWLNGNNFYDVTGMSPANLYNCRERSQKTEIAIELGLTHFIDDRPDVLEYMIGVVPHLYLFSMPHNTQRRSNPELMVAYGWRETIKLIKDTIR